MSASEPPWGAAVSDSFQRVSYGYAVRTGKMLQREPTDPQDQYVSYLKALHVQQDVVVGVEDLPEMWASRWDIKQVGVRAGDLLVCEGGQIGRSAFVPESIPVNTIIEKSLHRIRSRGSHSLRYLHYVLEALRGTGWLEARSGNATLNHLTGEALAELRIPLPVASRQRAIVAYLDRETAKIDAIATAKRRMVELLQEQLSESATNLLLGPPIPGAPAGPGQVALRTGWSLVPFRRLFREIDVRSSTGSETLLSVSQTRGVIPQADLGDRRQFAETLVGYKVCSPGDLVVNRMWVYYGALGSASIAGIVSPDYAVFRPTGQMSSEFAAYVLRTPAYVGEMTRLVRGIGAAFQGGVRKPRLHPSELGLIKMPVPTPSDQERLLHLLDETRASVARRTSLLDTSLRLLRERRQALITAALTGELTIPEAA